MNPFENDHSADGIRVTATATSFLEIGAKWARFLGIMGFICAGLMVLAGLLIVLVGFTMENSYRRGYGGGESLPMWLIGLGYFVWAIFYFLPGKAMYDFSVSALQAIASRDSIAMEAAMENLKKYFKVSGILMIVGIVLIFFVFMIAFIGALAANARF